MGWMTADEGDETYEWLRSHQRCKAKSEADREIEQNGCPKMKEHTLKAIAIQNDGYEAPELNDTLYLHFKGLHKIENLESYTGLTSLWLGTNGIKKIEGLGHLSQMRCLYIQQNLICEVGDGLKGLNNLTMVDISQNKLESFSGFECLPLLETLIANHNALHDARTSLGPLRSCPALKTLDIGNNSIGKITEDAVDVFSDVLSNLSSLTTAGNSFYQDALNLRKRMIAALPLLNYLDRPIFEAERVAIRAWTEGGREAESKARKAYSEAKQQKQRNQMKEFRSWQETQRYKVKMAKEARGGAAIQLTPDETRIIEERIIAAAAERELEHHLINEVGLGKLGDMCNSCNSTNIASLSLNNDDDGVRGVQREFGTKKISPSSLPSHRDRRNRSNDKDYGNGKEREQNGEENVTEKQAAPLCNVLRSNQSLDDGSSPDDSTMTMFSSCYDNDRNDNERSPDIDYHVSSSSSSNMITGKEKGSDPSFVIEDHLRDNLLPPRSDDSSTAVCHEITSVNGLLQRNELCDPPPPPPPQQQHAVLISSPLSCHDMITAAAEATGRAEKLAAATINDGNTLVAQYNKSFNTKGTNDAPLVEHEEDDGITKFSSPLPLHPFVSTVQPSDSSSPCADYNQHSKLVRNPAENDGSLLSIEQLGTTVPSTYKSRYLSCPVDLPSMTATQDSTSDEGADDGGGESSYETTIQNSVHDRTIAIDASITTRR